MSLVTRPIWDNNPGFPAYQERPGLDMRPGPLFYPQDVITGYARWPLSFRRQIPITETSIRFLQHPRRHGTVREPIGLMDGEHDPRHLMSRNQCAA